MSVATACFDAPYVVAVGVLAIERCSHDIVHIECHSGDFMVDLGLHDVRLPSMCVLDS